MGAYISPIFPHSPRLRLVMTCKAIVGVSLWTSEVSESVLTSCTFFLIISANLLLCLSLIFLLLSWFGFSYLSPSLSSFLIWFLLSTALMSLYAVETSPFVTGTLLPVVESVGAFQPLHGLLRKASSKASGVSVREREVEGAMLCMYESNDSSPCSRDRVWLLLVLASAEVDEGDRP